MSEIFLQSLYDYIEADLNGIGYKTWIPPEGEIEGHWMWKGDQAINDLINDPANGDTIQRQAVQPQEIVEQIVLADWLAITLEKRLYIQLLMSLPTISTVADATEIRANLLAIFTPGMETLTNLIAVVQRQGSPAEVQWGENTQITNGQIGRAANLRIEVALYTAGLVNDD